MYIIVIEDDDAVRGLISRILISEKHDVMEAANGKEGLALLSKSKKIDLIITDIIMPDVEGLETIREAKERLPQVKILAISGGGRIHAQDYLAIAKGLGADMTLQKPFIRQDLIDAVNQLTQNEA
ncbi:MAG: response regulator [Candidatus Zhuqueibacterota bacterium]